MDHSRDGMYPEDYHSKQRSHSAHKRDSYYPKTKSGMSMAPKHREQHYPPKPKKVMGEGRSSFNSYNDSYPSKRPRHFDEHPEERDYQRRDKPMHNEGRQMSYGMNRGGGSYSSRGHSGMRGSNRGSYPKNDYSQNDDMMYRKMKRSDEGDFGYRGGNDYDNPRGNFKPYRDNQGFSSQGRGNSYARRGRQDYGQNHRGNYSMGRRPVQNDRNSFRNQYQDRDNYQGPRDQRQRFDREPGSYGGVRRGRGFASRGFDRPFRGPQRPNRDESYEFRKPTYGSGRTRPQMRPMSSRGSHSSRDHRYDQDSRMSKPMARMRPSPKPLRKKHRSHDYDDEEEFERPPKRVRKASSDKTEGRRKQPKDQEESRSSSRSRTRELSKTPKTKGDGIKEKRKAEKKRKRSHSEKEATAEDVQEKQDRKTPEKPENDDPSDQEEEDEDKTKPSKGRRRPRSPSWDQERDRESAEFRPSRQSRRSARIRDGGATDDVYVELRCPHCPEHKSETFNHYRYHLDGRRHRQELDKLTQKHTTWLRRIRLQQRTELKEAEQKWAEDIPEEYERTVSRYCTLCKLAFKCLPEEESAEGIAKHNESELHKSQLRYLHPRCRMCRMSFPSRMVYEYHIASIRHLKMLSISKQRGKPDGGDSPRTDDEHSDAEDNLKDFITMDAVEEEEDLGAEKEEIEGNPEDLERAEEDAKEDMDDGANLEGDEFDLDEEDLDHEYDDYHHDDDMQDQEALGREFLVPFVGVFCDLCRKVFRADNVEDDDGPLESRAATEHCKTRLHLDNLDRHLEAEDDLDSEHDEEFDGEPEGGFGVQLHQSDEESDRDGSVIEAGDKPEDQDRPDDEQDNSRPGDEPEDNGPLLEDEDSRPCNEDEGRLGDEQEDDRRSPEDEDSRPGPEEEDDRPRSGEGNAPNGEETKDETCVEKDSPRETSPDDSNEMAEEV